MKVARRVRRAAWGNGAGAIPAPRPRPTQPTGVVVAVRAVGGRLWGLGLGEGMRFRPAWGPVSPCPGVGGRWERGQVVMMAVQARPQ